MERKAVGKKTLKIHTSFKQTKILWFMLYVSLDDKNHVKDARK